MPTASRCPDPTRRCAGSPRPTTTRAARRIWVTSDKWGPFQGELLHLSYGRRLRLPGAQAGGRRQYLGPSKGPRPPAMGYGRRSPPPPTRLLHAGRDRASGGRARRCPDHRHAGEADLLGDARPVQPRRRPAVRGRAVGLAERCGRADRVRSDPLHRQGGAHRAGPGRNHGRGGADHEPPPRPRLGRPAGLLGAALELPALAGLRLAGAVDRQPRQARPRPGRGAAGAPVRRPQVGAAGAGRPAPRQPDVDPAAGQGQRRYAHPAERDAHDPQAAPRPTRARWTAGGSAAARRTGPAPARPGRHRQGHRPRAGGEAARRARRPCHPVPAARPLHRHLGGRPLAGDAWPLPAGGRGQRRPAGEPR